MPFKTQVKRCEMKKLMITAALAASLAVPAVAQQAATAADPFVSTQGATTGLAVVGGATALVIIAAAANGESSSGTD